MSYKTQCGGAIPTVNVAINKSRLKTYSKDGKPTFYLTNGTEFQIELFNPTSEKISARISLNGKKIGQGGLILRPGERVFLDRYIDVPKKFRFETYEVNNSSEVRKAIESNGDLKVTFHKEYVAPSYFGNGFRSVFEDYRSTPWCEPIHPWNSPSTAPNPYNIYGTTCSSGYMGSDNTPRGLAGDVSNATNISASMDSLGDMNMDASLSMGADELKRDFFDPNARKDTKITNTSFNPLKRLKVRSKKTVETGRVEEGSHSSQRMTQVSLTFNETPFKTYEFNLLPESTKTITSQDLNMRRYCYNCGSKAKANYKFCPNCGSKT